MAFIVAGFIAIVTILISGCMVFAAGMSDSPSGSIDMGTNARNTFIAGMIIAVLVGVTHWVHAPTIGW